MLLLPLLGENRMYENSPGPAQFNRSIRIVRFTMQETGQYEPQFSRPYQPSGNMEALDNLTNRITEVTRGDATMRIDGSLISGLSGGLVVPQANWETKLLIPNGWNERRLRYKLELEVHTGLATELYEFQGYSEFFDVSMSGHINPDMVFYINSFMRINRARDYSGLSSAGYRDVVSEAAQIVDGQLHSRETGTAYGIRPEDVFVGVQSAHASQALQGINEGSVVDTRINRANDVFRTSRVNSIPSNYLGKVIENYRTATNLVDFGVGTDDIYSRAIQSSHEANPFENPFIRALSDQRGMGSATYFTMNDLVNLDPTAAERTEYFVVEDAGVLASVGQTDGWHRGDLETQLATILTNSVSGLMIANTFVNISFESTNMTLNAMPFTRILGGVGATMPDMRPFYNNFITRFETEILPDITHNNTIPVNMIVEADLYGDTKIQLSIDGGPFIPYISPTFADSIMAPVVTNNANNYMGLIEGVEHIMEYCKPTAYLESVRNSAISDI